MKNAVMYLKVSETDLGYSYYVDKLDKVAFHHELEIVKTADTITNLYLTVRKYKCSAVVVYNLADFGKTVSDILKVVHVLKENGVNYICDYPRLYDLYNDKDEFDLNNVAIAIGNFSYFINKNEEYTDENLSRSPSFS
jgi:hypothetical protein